MKTCPICHAIAFDDAERCYGCLHLFTDEAPYNPLESFGLADESVFAASGNAMGGTARQQAATSAFELPSFVIRIAPTFEQSGQPSWTCTVDLASA